MESETRAFAQVAVIIVFLATSLASLGLGVTWAAIRLKRKASEPLRMHDARLVQLQESVDAIAIEVERIAEAQRFSARLLSERVQA